jgi:hypothetical protein
MVKCNDPKQDCPCLKAGECDSKLPGYCCHYDQPVLVKETPKPIKAPELTQDNPFYKWANQGFETRIAALT